MSKYDDLDKLEELRQKGAISEDEFQREKAKILGSDNPAPENPQNNMMGLNLNNYIMLMHLSQFAGLILPGLGFIIPLIMWLVNKDKPEVNRHGKNIFNFIISMIIYIIIACILFIIVIGIPLLIALGIIEIVFIIIASIKASHGEYWRYPLSIPFFV